MRLFDTNVQELKYKVLSELVRLESQGKLSDGLLDIPEKIVPGPKATMRCCIYKERAIVSERVKLAMNKGSHEGRVVEVLEIACDECPVNRFTVTDACRGCIAHRCYAACPAGAITFDHQKATINSDKCKECGKCMKVCPYNAIAESLRPCIKGCKAKAISLDEQKVAKIDYGKCISCGNCVYQCPFGAIVDKSYILDLMNIIEKSDGGKNYRVYAAVAPAIVSQFSYAKVGQLVSGIKTAGFTDVVEVALGADIVAFKESEELFEKGFLTSSCCPAFVKYIKANYPKMIEHISSNVSPMAAIAAVIKKKDPTARVVFIGPCIAKKEEFKNPEIDGVVDCVITFEELQALFDGLGICVEELPEEEIDEASYYGRIFARSGGVTEAVASVMQVSHPDFEVKSEMCSGLDMCRAALLKAGVGKLGKNFIEGMACDGGCINGAACLTHGINKSAEIDKFGKKATAKSVGEAIDDIKELIPDKS